MKKSTPTTVKAKSTAAKPKSGAKESPVSKTTTGRPKSKPTRAPSGDGKKKVEPKGPSADADEVLQSREETYKRLCEESEMSTVPLKPVKISLPLIARRNLPKGIADGQQEKLIESLSKLTHVRLDRENIRQIDDLEMMGPVTNLYLQQNCIKKMENLESLQSLRFLTLANNQIERVENLTVLSELKLLDLSSNQIQELNTEELPRSLLILNLEDNPCCRQPDYRKRILLSLPKLKTLDGDPVMRYERKEAGCEVSSSSSSDEDEDEDEISEGDSAENDINDVLQLSSDLIRKSQARSKEYANEHYRHMEQLVDVRSQSQLAMNTARSSFDMTPRLEGTPRSEGATSALGSGRQSSGSSASR